jgi:transcriptional regulator with XRE-family HTH domain
MWVMARSPTHQHIIREIRLTLGWSQEDLSRRIGINAGTLNRIENGTLQVSKRVALRIFWATGVPWKDIVDNQPGRPRTRLGVLDKSHLQRLDDTARDLSDKDRDTMRNNHADVIDDLFNACLKDAPRKFWALDAAIMAALDEIKDEFALAGAVDEIHASRVDLELLERLKAQPVPPEFMSPKEQSASTPEHRQA